MSGNFREIGFVGLEAAPPRDHGMPLDAGFDGVFEVLPGIEFLGEIAAQEFKELDRIVTVFGAFGYRRA